MSVRALGSGRTWRDWRGHTRSARNLDEGIGWIAPIGETDPSEVLPSSRSLCQDACGPTWTSNQNGRAYLLIFMQSASAGPGVLLHAAASTLPCLEITIVAPGQVTETSRSPGLQLKSQLLLGAHVS